MRHLNLNLNLNIVNLIVSFFLGLYCLLNSYSNDSLVLKLTVLVFFESYIAINLEELINLSLFLKVIRFFLFLLLITCILALFKLR